MGSLSGGAVKPQSSVDVDESDTFGVNLEFPSEIPWRSSSKSMDDKLMYNNESIYGVGHGLPTHPYPVYTYIHIYIYNRARLPRNNKAKEGRARLPRNNKAKKGRARLPRNNKVRDDIMIVRFSSHSFYLYELPELSL